MLRARCTAVRAALALALALAATEAWAVVLYKLTDRAGRVTYADAVPRGFDGSVQALEIDTTRPARTAEAADVERAMRRYEEILRERPAPSASGRDAAIAAAQARVDSARAALSAAQESPSPEDWIYFGKARRAPRPEYEARLTRLELELREAEEALRAAERGG